VNRGGQARAAVRAFDGPTRQFGDLLFLQEVAELFV
jgi:hypothetical protein